MTGAVNDGSRVRPPSVSVFESVARLFAAATPGVDTTVIEAGESWGLGPLRERVDGVTVWGNLPAIGRGSLRHAVGRAVRREWALRELQRRHREAIDGIHRLPPIVRRSRLPPAIRFALRGGLLVELAREPHPRVIDLVAREAGAPPGQPIRLRPSVDGSALSRVESLDRRSLALRVAALGGRRDPGRNAEALVALERADVRSTPRLDGRGVTAGASWTTETWLPGRLTTKLGAGLVRDVIAFCATLPQHDESTALRDRVLNLGERFPRWAALAMQLAERTVTSQGILQHGDFWIGNLLVDHGRLSGVVDWDTWHPAGVPGVDLLQLVAMDRRSRSREDIGDLWCGGLWRSAEFVSAAQPYWRALGITVTDEFLEMLGLDWWSGQVFKRQSQALRPDWVEANIDRVLESIGGSR